MHPPNVTRPLPWPEDLLPRVLSLCGAALLLVLTGKLLLGPVRLATAPVQAGERIRLAFSMREPPGDSPVPPPLPDRAPPPSRTGERPPVRDARQPPSPAASRAPAQEPVQIYDADGRLLLPMEARDRWAVPPPSPAPAPGLARAPAEHAPDPLRKPNPVQARTTRFAGDWISDGDAADVAAQEIVRAQRRILQFLLGKDIEHARARPSPEVRFDPARHEQRSDLGSEATGDAYKAAPVGYEAAPGLDGEASRRIREQVAALEMAYARCDRARLRALMQPLLLHLDELQKAEAAMARGADPVRAEHMLPNVANTAYDMARRALWYANDRMSACVAR